VDELLARWPIQVEFRLASSLSGSIQAPHLQANKQQSSALAPFCRSFNGALTEQQQQPAADSPSSLSGAACRLAKFNETNFLCACDRFGFVALQQQTSSSGNQQLGNARHLGQAPADNAATNWPFQLVDGNNYLGAATMDPFGADPLGPNRNEQQLGGSNNYLTTAAHQLNSSQTPTFLGMLSILLGAILSVLLVGAFLFQMVGKLWQRHGAQQAANSRLKQKGLFDSFGSCTNGPLDSSGPPTTGPLVHTAADLPPSLGLLSPSNQLVGGTQTSSSIMGLNSAAHTLAYGQQQAAKKPQGQTHSIYAAAQSMGFPSSVSSSSSSHSPPTVEAYASMMSPSHYNNAHHLLHHNHEHHHHRHALPTGPLKSLGQLGQLTRWLASGPSRWFSGLTGSTRLSNNYAQNDSLKQADQAQQQQHQQQQQHRVLLGANGRIVSSLISQTSDTPNTTSSTIYKYQNGYTTALGLQQQHQQQQQQQQLQQRHLHDIQRNVGQLQSGGANNQQQNSSNSSYVSSSAYYEEISQPAPLADNQQQRAPPGGHSHTLIDPFRRQQTGIAFSVEHQPNMRQQQQQHEQPPTNNNYAAPPMSVPSGKQNDLGQAAHTISQPLPPPGASTATITPRHYLFASPSAVDAYKQQQHQFRGAQQHHR